MAVMLWRGYQCNYKNSGKNAGSINYEYGWYENGKGAGYKSNVYLQGLKKCIL